MAPVVVRDHLVIGQQTQIQFENVDGNDGGTRGSVSVTSMPWTTGESLLLIETLHSGSGPMSGSSNTLSTLYRVSASALTEVFEFHSTEENSEIGGTTLKTCKLAPFTVSAKIPRLVLDCAHESTGTAPRHDRFRYRWTGTRYGEE